MNLIFNIAYVAANFVRHPFSVDGTSHKTDAYDRYTTPTVTDNSSDMHGSSGGMMPQGAGDEIAAEVKAYNEAQKPLAPQPPQDMPVHKIALWFFIILAFGCLGAEVALAFSISDPYSPAQQDAVSLLDWGFKMGLGAIAGVLTGKAAALDEA